MHACFVHIHVYAPTTCLVPREARRVWLSLELELQALVNHHVGPGDQTLIFRKSSQCSQLLGHLSSLQK